MPTSGDRRTLSADGQTPARKFVGPVRVSYKGTFGGGTAKVLQEDPSGAFIDVTGSVKVAADDFVIDFPLNSVNNIKIDLSSSTTPAFVGWIQGMDAGSGAL